MTETVRIPTEQSEAHQRMTELCEGLQPYSGSALAGNNYHNAVSRAMPHESPDLAWQSLGEPGGVVHSVVIGISSQVGSFTVRRTTHAWRCELTSPTTLQNVGLEQELFMIRQERGEFVVDIMGEVDSKISDLVGHVLGSLQSILENLEDEEFQAQGEVTPAPPLQLGNPMEQFLKPPSPFADLEEPPSFPPLINLKKIRQSWRRLCIKMRIGIREAWKNWNS